MPLDQLVGWVPTPVPGLRFLEVEDGALILDPATKRLHSLNGWATVVWLLCDGKRSADRIIELAGEGDERRRRSVSDALDTLKGEGLVVPAPP